MTKSFFLLERRGLKPHQEQGQASCLNVQPTTSPTERRPIGPVLSTWGALCAQTQRRKRASQGLCSRRLTWTPSALRGQGRREREGQDGTGWTAAGTAPEGHACCTPRHADPRGCGPPGAGPAKVLGFCSVTTRGPSLPACLLGQRHTSADLSWPVPEAPTGGRPPSWGGCGSPRPWDTTL